MDYKNKFQEGQLVFERIRPTNRLVVSRFQDGLYYCKAQEGMARKELVYLEVELTAAK